MAAASGQDGDPDSGEDDLLDPVNAAGVSDSEQAGQQGAEQGGDDAHHDGGQNTEVLFAGHDESAEDADDGSDE